MFHEFGGDTGAVERVYAAVDEQIGRVLEACDPDVVFLASDHGMGEYSGDHVRVNSLLRDSGYVETTRGGQGMPSWEPIRQRLREGDEETDRKLHPVERLAALSASVGITTHRVGRVLDRLGLDEFARRHVPDGVVRTGNEQVDFAESVAYMRARAELGVRLNVEGREPDGVVPPEEYESVRDELVELLRGVTTPRGEPVFESVEPREAHFEGPELDRAPDVVTVPREFDHFLSAEPRAEQFVPNQTPWDHKRDGVFAAAGDVDTTATPVEPHLFDVAPTVLAALGVPVSDRMDGRVLPVVEETDSRAYDEHEADITAAEADIEDRLADLGYL